ncbi:MAG: alpha/beta hydrolase [Acidimicrobiia bacterium]|nr:alpha/beta hydrolase [Acidimicrobiia bacterium]
MRKLLTTVVAALALALVTTACDPPGRYFNEVFPSATVTRDLQYGAAPDENGVTERLLLDLYQPTGDDQARRPAIVWVHGGGFSAGNKSNMADDATTFARRGYATVSINYRLRQGNIGQAIIDAQHDAQAAVRWLRRYADRYRIDRNRIAIGGSSAGAITALYVANHPEDPGTSGNAGYRSDVQVGLSRSGFGGWYSAGDPPIALFHGTADQTVPYETGVSTCDSHRRAGNTCQLTTYQGAGHGLYPEYREDFRAKASAFLYEHLNL